MKSTFPAVPVNQLPAYAIKRGVISFAKLSLLVLLRENTDSLLQILFQLVALSGYAWFFFSASSSRARNSAFSLFAASISFSS